MINVTCIECKKAFEAQRSSAKFCSANCRVKFNNKLGAFNGKVTTADKIKPPKKGDKINKQIGIPDWTSEIEAYCAQEGIFPSDLIETHKKSKSAAFATFAKKSVKESKIHDFTQDKSYGKPYDPMDNPIFKSKMGLK